MIQPFGMGFIGWPNALFVSLDDLDRFALTLAEPANGARVRGDRAGTAYWTSGTGWGGVTFNATVDVERRFCALIADNGWSRARVAARLAQTIRHVVLEKELPAPPPTIPWTTASPTAHENLIGVYENETTFEIAVRDGKLTLQSGASVEEVMQGAENLFRAPIMMVENRPAWSLTFSVEASSGGKARLLRIGSRVWARKQL